MPQIIPIKDLKNTRERSEMCHKSEDPIFVTKNGYGDMVIMSIEVYEKMYPDKIQFLKFQIFIDNINNAISFHELCNCFSEFFQYIIPEDQQSQNKLISLNILRAKNFIHEYYFKPITLEEIAHYLKITPEYLGTQFKKELGINFSTYLKNYRIQKAKELLLTTDLKLYEISKKVGYNDIKYFSHIFKEITGKTSADFRNK